MKAREKLFAVLRIAFGAIWAIDALLKWQPGFFDGFVGYLTDAMQGQPALAANWINLWASIVSIHPGFFATLTALIETALAISLMFGIFTRVGLCVGAVFSMLIWSTAEGFGGPYVSGATDVGSAIVYALVFILLWAGESDRVWSVDERLRKKYPLWRIWRDDDLRMFENKRERRKLLVRSGLGIAIAAAILLIAAALLPPVSGGEPAPVQGTMYAAP